MLKEIPNLSCIKQSLKLLYCASNDKHTDWIKFVIKASIIPKRVLRYKRVHIAHSEIRTCNHKYQLHVIPTNTNACSCNTETIPNACHGGVKIKTGNMRMKACQIVVEVKS